MAWEKVSTLMAAAAAIYPVTFDFSKYRYRAVRTHGQMHLTTGVARYQPLGAYFGHVVSIQGGQTTAEINSSHITGGQQHLLGFTDDYAQGY